MIKAEKVTDVTIASIRIAVATASATWSLLSKPGTAINNSFTRHHAPKSLSISSSTASAPAATILDLAAGVKPNSAAVFIISLA